MGLLLASCTATEKGSNNYKVEYKGALKNAMFKGDLSAKIDLSDLQNTTHLYALGAFENLKGEVQIFAGKPFNTSAEDGVLVFDQSFNKKAIDRVKVLDSSLRTYYLLGSSFNNFYKEAKATSSFDFDHEGVGVHQNYLNEENINSLMESGIKIFAWTVNNPADMDKFLQLGIEGIITDSPEVLIKKMAINCPEP